MFIIDAHLDLSMNAMEWNRDLRKPVKEINERERGLTDKPDRGNATVSFPELRKGNIGLVVATQIGRYVSAHKSITGMAFAGAGLGTNTRTACLVQSNGGIRRNDTDQ